MLELLSYPFMQRALIAGALVALLSSYYGPFVVHRRMAFLGNGLAHAAFGGVALGLLLGLNPLAIAIPYTIAVALGIVWVKARAEMAADTAIGIFFAVSMALGVVFLSFKEGYTQDLSAILFGSLLSVSRTDIWLLAGAVVLTAFTIPLWPRWAYATFDETLARADRIPVRRDDTLLTVVIALIVVLSIKTVGVVLVAAFLVLPTAIARLLTRTFSAMSVATGIVAVSSTFAGLVASYYANLPSGASIVLVQAVTFFTLLLAKRRGASA